VTEVESSGTYYSDPDSVGIWFINPDGTNRRIFLKTGDMPDWSPDGDKLALVMGGQIYSVKVIGDSIIQLTIEGTNLFPDWSPDGKYITYDSNFNDPVGAYVIWIMDANGENKQDISQHLVGEWRMPDWSPDGLRIAHLRYIGIGTPEIFLMDTTGENEVRLTNNSRDDRYPIWSPSGSKILFESQEEGELVQIWIMNADGSNPRQLTTEGGKEPSWSPDGSQIVYSRYNPWEFSDENGRLWIMNSDGSSKRQLTF
jgi:Tol biopolymer transport system component